MNRTVYCRLALCGFLMLAARVGGAADAAPEGIAGEPILRLEPGGPTSFVSALAFSPDGRTLYAAGWDKVAYVWLLDPRTGAFHLDAAATYRLPLGPGLHGVLNALAVSPDGSLLAVAGQGLVQVASDLRHPGFEVPEIGGLDATGYQQQGTIYVFDTRQRTARPLIGHYGPVVALAFAPAAAGKPPLLVSAAKEWNPTSHQTVAAVRLWDAAKAEYLSGLELPFSATRPAIVAWQSGAALKQLRVAIAWGDASAFCAACGT